MVKINRLEVENIKRVQAVQIEPTASGLTIIGGRNAQGKTSVLDAILWALGGNRYKPSDAKREGAVADPNIRIELDNGILVTRDGKNASLKVIDQHGNKAGQALLDELVGQMAIDLPRFMAASTKEKAETLLKIIGVGGQLFALDRKAEQIYNERHSLGQIAERKKKHAEDLPLIADAPTEEVSASDLIRQQQEILGRNGENQRLRSQRDELTRAVEAAEDRVADLRRQLVTAEGKLNVLQNQLAEANKSAEQLADESTAEIEASIRAIDETNQKVRSNAAKRQAESDAADLQAEYDEKTTELEGIRLERTTLLDHADLPLPGLSVTGGELTYDGQKWDCMSSADQLRVAVAIARRLRPSCQFVLLDKAEQMDLETLAEFGRWAESEGLQIIATRVSTGGECSIIIEDGMVRPATVVPQPVADATEGF